MTSYSDQIAATKNAHVAVNALDLISRNQVSTLLADYQAGNVSEQAVRYKLEAIVRDAYRSSGVIGSQLVSNQAELDGWSPQEKVFSSKYLVALLADVRRNLRDYKAGPRDDAARRRLQLRIQASASVGVQRGYTDAQLKGYTELKDFGYQLRKVWVANFDGNEPCPLCAALHGQEVELDQVFTQGVTTVTKVYHNLEGPPRHPNCQCTLVVLITTLDNAFDSINLTKPDAAATEMSTAQVQAMPKAFFAAAVKTLQRVIQKLRKK